MKSARRGIRAGAEVDSSKNSQANCPASRPLIQDSFQTVAALANQVLEDLRHASEPLEA